MKPGTIIFSLLGFAVVGAAVVLIPDWHAPVHGVQLGPDGTSMVQFDNTSPWRVATAPSSDGSFAAAIASKDPQLQAITRAMTDMTQAINTRWRNHVGAGGVTCFTCHRNQAIPPETWFPRAPKETPAMFARSENWNESAQTVRNFFPDNGWALYFLQNEPIHVQSKTALRSGTVAPQLVAKRVYEFMMQMSDGIGVNCGYCHNSRALADWSQSTPNRWVGYDAIRMTRDIDQHFLFNPAHWVLQSREYLKQNTLVIPADRRVAAQAPGLVVCATCHYGHTKPDFGTVAVKNYPATRAPASRRQASANAPGQTQTGASN
jgi:photosynthetic reaction center cytochrome c subunit